MTKTLEDALAKVREWPDSRQDDAARLLLAMQAQNDARYTLTNTQVERVQRSKTQAETGEFVTDEDAEAFFTKFGL